MKRYECKYEYSRPWGSVNHSWSVVGARLGIHVHIADQGEERAEKHQIERYSGGIEFHYRSPPPYMADQCPSQKTCWLLGCPCWHDGSSMQASDFWIPFWLQDPHNHERMFREIERRLEEADGGAPQSIVSAVCAALDAKEEPR